MTAVTDSNSIRAYINQSLNGIGTVGSYVLNGNLVPPAVLGYMGGWLIGVGVERGLLQGVTSGVYHLVVHNPVAKYVDANRGIGPYDIHPNTAALIKVVGVVAGVAVPILVVSYCGDAVIAKATSHLAEEGTIKWLLTSVSTRPYTIFAGILVNIAPAVAQHWISWWRAEDKEAKRKY